jgi:hypothetical protein
METLTAGWAGSSCKSFSTACAGQSTEVREARGAAGPSLAPATPVWPSIDEACRDETWHGAVAESLSYISPRESFISSFSALQPMLLLYSSGENATSGPHNGSVGRSSVFRSPSPSYR